MKREITRAVKGWKDFNQVLKAFRKRHKIRVESNLTQRLYIIACSHMIECVEKRSRGLLGIAIDDDIWARRYRAWDNAAGNVLHRIIKGEAA